MMHYPQRAPVYSLLSSVRNFRVVVLPAGCIRTTPPSHKVSSKLAMWCLRRWPVPEEVSIRVPIVLEHSCGSTGLFRAPQVPLRKICSSYWLGEIDLTPGRHMQGNVARDAKSFARSSGRFGNLPHVGVPTMLRIRMRKVNSTPQPSMSQTAATCVSHLCMIDTATGGSHLVETPGSAHA